MTARYSQRELAIPARLVTANAVYRGKVAANYHSLTDSLNAADRTFVALSGVDTRSVARGEVTDDHAGAVLLKKDRIIIAIPEGDLFEERSAARAVMGDRPVRVVVRAGPLSLRGVLRWPLGTALPEYLVSAAWTYIPVTDALVVHNEPGLGQIEAEYLLLNRQAIEAVIELDAPASPTAAAPGATPTPLPEPVPEARPLPLATVPDADEERRIIPIDGLTAQRILLATDVFDDADPDVLLELMNELTRSNRVMQERIPSGTEVIKEGDEDDTLYIIHRGSMEVVIDDGAGGVAPVARLRPGELFGEMAFLGNRRRSATVRALTDSAVLVLPANSWKELAAKVPNATSRLMRIMAQRGGPPSRGLLSRINRPADEPEPN